MRYHARMAEEMPISYRYTFTFDDCVKKVFEVRLDSRTLNVLPLQAASAAAPEWTRLEHQRCENCPLRPETTPCCPIALNMAVLVKSFGAILSYEMADVLVEMQERSVFKRVAVQSGLYSLMGIYMSASGCPVMDPLKPLVRFHLPFSSIDETVYRVVAMYVTAQFLRANAGLSADGELEGLARLFTEVHKVNVGFCLRLRGAIDKDALVNSVTILDAFVAIGQPPTPKRLAAVRRLFTPYLEGAPGRGRFAEPTS